MDDDDETALRAAIAMSLEVPSPTDSAPSTAAEPAGEQLPGSVVGEVLRAAWGDRSARPEVLEVIRRWLQGFVFRPDEPTALVQGSGGPCAIIAAAQGHLLKNLIYGVEVRQGGDWRTPQDIDAALAVALTEILVKCAREDRDGTDRPVLVLPVGPVTTIEAFHANLAATAYGSAAEAQATIASNIGLFHSEHGVLLFLYSCVATRGIAQIAEDLGLDVEPLVVLPFGHANQSLINLMLTGIATPHVHDGVKDVGMALKGVLRQPDVGYLTVMESLRYIQVGQYLKNPKFPIWLVGSETHITCLFSLDTRLVQGEGPVTKAKRVFNEFDGSGGGFVMADVLPEILRNLGIAKTPQEMNTLTMQMGGDIILLSSFLKTIFPGQTDSDIPSEFVVYHYNGIAPPGGLVRYARGVCKSEAPKDFGARPILQVLRTKWSPLSIEFERDITI